MKDQLFANYQGQKFSFNEEVVAVFDDMLQRSIPFYQENLKIIKTIIKHFLREKALVWDLGCSTGMTIETLVLEREELHYIGVDNSQPMLDKAGKRLAPYRAKTKIDLVCQDIKDLKLDSFTLLSPQAILLNYTLQFLNLAERKKLLKQLYHSLAEDGILVISEKVREENAFFNDFFIEEYFKFKKQKGYSELEIANKREALENILIPISLEDNKSLLQECGFKKVSVAFKWYNFCIFLVKRI